MATPLIDLIVGKLQLIGGAAIDDHAAHKEMLFDHLSKISAVGVIRGKIVGFIPDATQDQCVNELYIGEEGMVHIGRSAVGIIAPGQCSTHISNITRI
jgi:hypothetical protein